MTRVPPDSGASALLGFTSAATAKEDWFTQLSSFRASRVLPPG